MTTRKITDMNLVADASNVRCVMIANKNIKVAPLADHHLKHQRHQIIRDADLIFYNEAKPWTFISPWVVKYDPGRFFQSRTIYLHLMTLA